MNDLRETHQSIAVEHLSDGGEANIFKTLTRQQTVIMDHVANGLTNKEIAQRLCVSPSTVKTHILMIYQRTGLPNRIALALHWLIFTGVLTRVHHNQLC